MSAEQKIEWRENAEVPNLHEAFVRDKLAAWIYKRPWYCDRGHWQTQVELAGIDTADAFPRYFMRFETAKQEIEDFLKWRLWKIPAPRMVIEPLPAAVHILFGGLPVCMFTLDVPAKWPEGHKWVGGDESEAATCAKCKEGVDRMIAGARRGG